MPTAPGPRGGFTLTELHDKEGQMREKTYHGTRGLDGPVVMVEREGEEPYPLRHIALHSPTGIEWGFGGSGPSDLAIALIADLLGLEDEAILEGLRRTARPVSPAVVQEFKWAHVAQLPHERWTLRESDLLTWLAERDLRPRSAGVVDPRQKK